MKLQFSDISFDILATKTDTLKLLIWYLKVDIKVCEKWLHNELLPRLEEQSFVIFDNASFHQLFDTPPTSTTEKDSKT